jgi:hypothetical protein
MEELIVVPDLGIETVDPVADQDAVRKIGLFIKKEGKQVGFTAAS